MINLQPTRRTIRRLLAALCAWSGERYGIDPAYLGVLLLAFLQLAVQRTLGK